MGLLKAAPNMNVLASATGLDLLLLEALTSGSNTTDPTQNSYTTKNIFVKDLMTTLGLSKANKIINGDMRIDQRNAGASVLIGATQYTVDRWGASAGAVVNKYTVGQNYGGVAAPAGFTDYLGCKTTTAYTPGSTDAVRLYHGVEGLNCRDLNWGTTNAKAITISFWVYSGLTGSWSGSVQNNAGDRCYPFGFTINSASTWEQKTVTIPGDTSGTWLTSTSAGLFLYFALGCGSSKLGTANAWAAAGYYGVTGSNQMLPVLNTTFYLTGVKLEVGSIVTPFVPDDYAAALDKCTRYCQPLLAASNGNWFLAQSQPTNRVEGSINYKQMRAAPTVTMPAYGTGAGQIYCYSGVSGTLTSGGSWTAANIGTMNARFYIFTSAVANGEAIWVEGGSGSPVIMLDAEL